MSTVIVDVFRPVQDISNYDEALKSKTTWYYGALLCSKNVPLAPWDNC